ncbi:MAG TPA: hypothetical protein PLU47_16445 [Azonexus sp.]|nr:hypothetical protein [Azonexus sp.]
MMVLVAALQFLFHRLETELKIFRILWCLLAPLFPPAKPYVKHQESQHQPKREQEELKIEVAMNQMLNHGKRRTKIQDCCDLPQFGQNLVPGARFALQSAQLPGTKAVPHWAQ